MNTERLGEDRVVRRRRRRLAALGVGLALLLGAACGHPEECPEPCPSGMYCNYGACVPAHDAGDVDDDAAD